MVTSYPLQFDVDFPTRALDRLTTALRIFAAIPILVLLGLLSQDAMQGGDHHTTTTFASGVGLLFLPIVLMLLFRQKYPRWWFDWNLNLLRFSNRVTAYPGRSVSSLSTGARSDVRSDFTQRADLKGISGGTGTPS